MLFIDMVLGRPMLFVWLLVVIAGGYVVIWTILRWRRQKTKREAEETDRKKRYPSIEDNGPGFDEEIRRIRDRVSFLEVEIPGLEKLVEAMVLTLPNGGTEELVKHWAKIDARNVRLDYLRQELKELREILKHV